MIQCNDKKKFYFFIMIIIFLFYNLYFTIYTISTISLFDENIITHELIKAVTH